MIYNYHVDHIHPKAMFTDARLKKEQFDKGTVQAFQDQCNYLPNLMLLEYRDNVSKSKRPLKKWIESRFNDTVSMNAYLQSHFISIGTSLELQISWFFINKEKKH